MYIHARILSTRNAEATKKCKAELKDLVQHAVTAADTTGTVAFERWLTMDGGDMASNEQCGYS
jgi:hypothetical protein